MSADATVLSGRLVLDDRVEDGRVTVADGWITAVEPGAATAGDAPAPYIAPGFVDVHVHGGGGHDAMGGRAALDGMARHLLRHGVTSFLPTGVSAPLDDLYRFVDDVRDWMPVAPGRRGGAARGRTWKDRGLAHAAQGRSRPRPAARAGGPATRATSSPISTACGW